MRKMFLATVMATLFMAPAAQAQSINGTISDIGVDRFAHFGCSYVINSELKKAGMNDFWAGFTTLAIGAAKEQWVDDHFDRGDFAADAAGVLMFNVKF